MKKLLVILLMLVAVNANAQWVQMSNGMVANEWVLSLTSNETNLFAGTLYNGVYISSNNGSSWSQTSLNNQEIRTLVISGNSIIAGGPGGVFISTNNGNNWIQNTLNNELVLTLAYSGNNIYAGVWLNGVYLSTNNGMNWTQTSLNGVGVYSITILENNIFAGSYLFGVYHSTNNGTNWTQTSLNNLLVYSLATIGNNIFAGTTSFGGVYLSTNNGTNWTLTSLNNKTVVSLVTNGNNVFAGTGTNFEYYGVYISTNNGSNWVQKNQGFSAIPTVRALLIKNNYIFAGTGNSYACYGVWRRSLSEIIGIQNISTEIPSAYSLSQNYPNPFNPTTNIKFSIPAVSSPRVPGGDLVQLKVYDVTGREVQTLVNERLQPGTYEASFDGAALNTGVYFYKLVTGNFSETKKMLLIK